MDPEDEWVAAVRAKSRTPVAASSALREIAAQLVSYDQLLWMAPKHVRALFAQIPDSKLSARARSVEERVLEGDMSFTVPNTNNLGRLVESVGAHLAGLDSALSLLRGSSVVSDPESNYLVGNRPDGVFVIPHKSDFFGDLKSRSNAYSPRRLKHHRVIPTRIDDYDVRLKHIPFPLGGVLTKAVFGGAIFSGLSPATKIFKAGFIFTGLSSPDREQKIQDFVKRAHLDACTIFSFPELSITPEERQRIVALLKEKPWIESESHSLTQPSLVILGSWHDNINGLFYNISHVVDGNGVSVGSYSKILPFIFDGIPEKIKSGKEIPVFILEDCIISLTICKDFCDRSESNMFSGLGVDLFLVPSFGNQNAMDGHLSTAKDVKNRFGSRVFVVQHGYDGGKPVPLGFVLSPFSPYDKGAAALAVNEEWTLHKSD